MRAWPARLVFGRWPLLLVAACATLAAGPVDAAPGAAGQKQVLVVYSTRRDAQASVVGDRELPRILEDGLPDGLDFYSEYIDRARFPDRGYQAAFSEFLRLKYKGQRFDLVIAMHDAAIEFVNKTRRELFPETPVVFSANASVTRPANSTGLTALLAFRRTVALAVELQPDIRQVFIVSGAEIGDRAYEQQVREQLQSFEPRLTVTSLSGLPTKELEARLATLPDHSIVYFVLVSKDGAGENFHPLEYVDRVTGIASAPTYCWVDSAMNHGIVGGSLKSQEAEATAVADLALRVLKGERADSIPLSTPDLNVPQVDWRQLQRWGISEARVPAGTLVRFREPTPWERYKGYIVGAVTLMLAQAALIAGLLVQRARRRQAEVALRASKAALKVVDARLLGAEEGERARIARELHDDIGQRIAVLTMDLDDLGFGRPLVTSAWRSRTRALSSRARELAKDIQSISRALHSSRLDDLGLIAASAGFCREASERQTLNVVFSAHDMPEEVPRDVALCVFRVLQEAVNNATKHAHARHVTVVLRNGAGEIQLEVADDGVGFDPGAAMKGPGLGLISMHERLGILDGQVFIESRPGAGATVRARVPLSRPVPVSSRVSC
jgi:signal transduction histidine kinase